MKQTTDGRKKKVRSETITDSNNCWAKPASPCQSVARNIIYLNYPEQGGSSLPGGDVRAVHPAWGQRDILVVHGRLAIEAVTERNVQPAVEAA